MKLVKEWVHVSINAHFLAMLLMLQLKLLKLNKSIGDCFEVKPHELKKDLSEFFHQGKKLVDIYLINLISGVDLNLVKNTA